MCARSIRITRRLSHSLADGWFSVVIGNRFPKRQEGFVSMTIREPKARRSLFLSKVFPSKDWKRLPAPGVKMRAAFDWQCWRRADSFRCYRKIEFSASVKALGDPLQTLRLTLPESAPGAPDAVKYVRVMFSQGYAPLSHNTRIGDNLFLVSQPLYANADREAFRLHPLPFPTVWFGMTTKKG